MQITEKDIEILKWINRFRYTTAKQVMEKFGMCKSPAYRRLKFLKDNGYLYYRKFFKDKPGIFFCTVEGVGVSGSKLSPLKRKISLATYDHNLIVIDVSFKLEKYGNWITDREIWSEIFKKQKEKKTNIHIPDGIIENDGKRTAVEVELTPKSKSRLDKIMKAHRRSRFYDSVFYVVGSEAIGERIKRNSGPLEIKIKLLSEVLKSE